MLSALMRREKLNGNDSEPRCASIWFPRAYIHASRHIWSSCPAPHGVHRGFLFPVQLHLLLLFPLCRGHTPAPVNQLHVSWCTAKTSAASPLMCPYQMNVAYYRRGGVSWAALWTKEGPARAHERDIVQYGPYSSFVDKWIFMLIKSDTDMSENCGECGIILTFSALHTDNCSFKCVWSGIVLQQGFLFGVTFNLEQYAPVLLQTGTANTSF